MPNTGAGLPQRGRGVDRAGKVRSPLECHVPGPRQTDDAQHHGQSQASARRAREPHRHPSHHAPEQPAAGSEPERQAGHHEHLRRDQELEHHQASSCDPGQQLA